MSDPVYVTTPLFYVNAEPHIGSTYTTVICDSFARFSRQRGRETFLLTGTDEHGDKIAEAALAAGVSPQTLVDDVSGKFRSTWDSCGIAYDHFIRTTDSGHVRFVQEVLSRLHAAGEIVFASYTGLYCTGCERFYTEKELRDGLCPDHLVAPKEIAEDNYFFRMSRWQERVLEHLTAHPDFVRPEGFRNEALAMLREPLGDLCISRPKSRLTWGIELPFDREYVTYVWFDALLNYRSALDVVARPGLWSGAQHFIGKDILKPHAVFWPTMLLAAGFPLYRHLNVHGYWSSGGQKMSKSLGNVVKPLEIRDRYGMDSLRYFLLREMAFGQDGDFTEDALVVRINADLANGIGNLASRTLAMAHKYFAGQVQPVGTPTPLDRGLEAAFRSASTEVDALVPQLAFHRALEAIWRAIDVANKYIVETAPFTLAKDPQQLPRVGEILHHCTEALRVAGQLVAPFLPDTAERLRRALGLAPEAFARLDMPWGQAFPDGAVLGEPVALFPRIDRPAAPTPAAASRKPVGRSSKPPRRDETPSP